MLDTSVEQFLEAYLRKIVKHPDSVVLSRTQGSRSDYVIHIGVDREDIGKIIGRDGKMISALKTVISALKAKDSISYELTVVAN